MELEMTSAGNTILRERFKKGILTPELPDCTILMIIHDGVVEVSVVHQGVTFARFAPRELTDEEQIFSFNNITLGLELNDFHRLDL